MPLPEDYVMDPGVDPTSTFGGYAYTLNQMVTLETPNAYRGMTVYSETAPAVVGQPVGYPDSWYAWNKRNLWIKPSTGQIYVYSVGAWISPQFAAGSLNGAAFTDYTIDISKLKPGAGNAFKIIRVNAGGTAFEFVASAALYTPGSFNANVLVPGAEGTMIATIGGVVQWTNATTYIGTAIAPTIAGVISTAYAYTDTSITDYDAAVQIGAITSQVYYFNGTSKAWGYADTLLRNGQVSLAKLNVTAETGLNILRVNAGHTAVETVTAAVATAPVFAARQYATTVPNQITIDAGLPSPIGLLTFPHGLAAMPSKVRFVYVQIFARNGYAIGDEYPVDLIVFGTGTGVRGADTTNVYYYQNSNVGTVLAKNANTTAPYVSGDVRLKAYAEL